MKDQHYSHNFITTSELATNSASAQNGYERDRERERERWLTFQ
jgi:hypothetical protein